MNIMPELDCEQVNLIIDKVVFQFGLKDTVVLQYIRNMDMDYEKLGSSSCNFEYIGVSQKIIQMLHERKHVTHIKIIGRAEWIDGKPTKVAQSFVWNIPCDMYIDELQTTGGFEDMNITNLYLVGEMR